MVSAPAVRDIGVGLRPGEVDVSLMKIEGLDIPKGTQVPKLEELMRPEDLSLMITGSQPGQ